MASQVEIIVDGVDVTNRVVYASAYFESQQNAVPGTFEITIKDPARNYTPPDTGAEITLELDGVRHFGGYVTQISRKFAFPADVLPADSRMWVLRGVDYNILFDKRVTRNTSNYTRSLPKINGGQMDGYWIRNFCANYLDLPAGFDSTTFVDDVAYPFYITSADSTKIGGWKQQGTPWREQMELMQVWSGAVFYVSPNLELHWHAIEDDSADFGFSDTPNGTTTIGMRDVTATERGGPQMTNDAFVWGGSEWSEDVVFDREQNSSSITDHGRWQKAEHHFGEDGFKTSTGVEGRSSLIVNGSPVVVGFNPGEAFPQYDLTLTWFGENQPAGQQIRAGQLVSTNLSTFGAPFTPMILPMRSIRISFPGVNEAGEGHVQLTGTMGLALSDPFSIWGNLRKLRKAPSPMVSVASNTTTVTTYGGFGQFTPVLVSGLVYKTPNDTPYIAGTTQVYEDGVLLQRDVDYTESDPVAGRITFSSAPSGTLWLAVRTA